MLNTNLIVIDAIQITFTKIIGEFFDENLGKYFKTNLTKIKSNLRNVPDQFQC